MSRVLVVGDLHAPATHPGYLAFCRDIFAGWDCDRVVFIGDIVDWHRVSRHVKNSKTRGASDEYREALQEVRRWRDTFPVADVTEGNHDKRIRRASWDAEIPEEALKGYRELWQTPRWTWHVDDQAYVVIDDVNYSHGTTASGTQPALGLASLLGQSAVIGHFHKLAAINWIARPDVRRFGMSVGCGVDAHHPSMRYGAEYALKGVLSCGVVIDGMPFLEVMPCGPKERYHRSRFKKGAR